MEVDEDEDSTEPDQTIPVVTNRRLISFDRIISFPRGQPSHIADVHNSVPQPQYPFTMFYLGPTAGPVSAGPSDAENAEVGPELEPQNIATPDANPDNEELHENEEHENEPKEGDDCPDEDEEPSKKRALDQSDLGADDDGTLCPICLDNWTNDGEHRICALKCGHLFGLQCVNRWLGQQNRKTCPTCKKKVGKNDIRYIYAKKLIAVDKTEVELIKQELHATVEEKNRLKADLARYVCQNHSLTQEVTHLKTELAAYRTNSSKLQLLQSERPIKILRPYMDKTIEICRHGESRVFDTNCRSDLLLASAKSPTLFPDYGLSKIFMSTYRQAGFFPIHSKQIRDICFHPSNDSLVLTASMDKTFKISSNVSNCVTHQCSHQMPIWSCAWDVNNEHILYVGTQMGSVIKYDIRNLTDAVADLSVEGDGSPVVSIATIPSGAGEVLCHGAVISCKLRSLWMFENYNDYKRYPLPLDGPFVSMKYSLENKQLLVSARPNFNVAHSRHILCNLQKIEDIVSCNPIHTFRGGGMQKLLSKSCFFTHNGDYIAAHEENSKSVYLWSINTGEKVGSIPARDAVYDLKGVRTLNGDYLVSLTEKKLEFFKFI